MEKINNNIKKSEKNKKNKDSHKHHHHRRLSIDKINTRFLDFIRKAKCTSNDQSMKDMKLNSINISNMKESENTEISIDKKIFKKRTSSNISASKIERNYYKNKLEKFPKHKKYANNNNINYKLIDYNIIINNNKTNYYYKENKNNYELNFTPHKNPIKNSKFSSINNFKGNNNEIILTKTECKPNKNITYNFNYNVEQKNFIHNPKYNQDYSPIKNKEDNYNKNQKKKEIQDNKLKNSQNKNNQIMQKEKTEKINYIKDNNFKEKEMKISITSTTKNKKYYEKKIEQMNIEKQKLFAQKESKPKNTIDKQNFITNIKTYLSQYIHINNLLETFPGGFNYLKNKLIYLDVSNTDEEFNFIYTQKNFYKSQNVKELFRKGIPIKYIKIFIQKLLNLENCKENYNFKFSMIFKNLDTSHIGDYVPYYYGKKKTKLKEILSIHYLNEEGIKQLKIIMWLISDLVPKIEYSPFLVKICSILLTIFEKEEAFETMRTLIDMNYDPSELYKLRWHFRYSFSENKKLVESIQIFLENQSDNIKELFDIFRNKGLEPLFLINEFVESLFLDFLNFYGILRFICIFLYEGVKALYRVSYGILNYIYEKNLGEIKNCRKDLMSELKRIIFNTFDYNKIFEDAFNLQLSRFNNGYIKGDNGEEINELEIPFECASKYYKNDNIEEESNSEKEKLEQKQIEQVKQPKKNHNYISNFYLPSIEPKSNILTGKYIFKLWPKLPKKFRKYNLATIYSLSRKKVNMKSILELSSKYPKHLKIMILIETEQEELFGMILPQMLEDTGEDNYIKLEKCYLINFLPKINVYNDNNEIICEQMLCCNKKGLWFCKEQVGVLIFIDGTLDEGITCKKNTYFGNINLTKKGNFLIKDFEIIVLVENSI